MGKYASLATAGIMLASTAAQAAPSPFIEAPRMGDIPRVESQDLYPATLSETIRFDNGNVKAVVNCGYEIKDGAVIPKSDFDDLTLANTTGGYTRYRELNGMQVITTRAPGSDPAQPNGNYIHNMATNGQVSAVMCGNNDANDMPMACKATPAAVTPAQFATELANLHNFCAGEVKGNASQIGTTPDYVTWNADGIKTAYGRQKATLDAFALR